MEGLELPQLELLIFALAGMVLITLVALVVYVVVASRQQRAKATQVSEDREPEPGQAPPAAGQILTLVREEAGGPLQVEIAGTRHRSLAEIKDPQLRRQVVESALQLVQFTGVLGAEVVAPAPLEKTYSWREDLRENSQGELDRIQAAPSAEEPPPQPAPAAGEAAERFRDVLAAEGQRRAPPQKPSLASSLQYTLRPRLPDSDQPRTFVDDIEGIIQRRIQLIPALQGRGLHVQSGPGGSVRFLFEGQEYESVDDVPNLTARQLIKDSIREWDETA